MALPWNNDAELFDRARHVLYTAVVGDIMDQMGYLRQFLPPQIRPLQSDMVVIGPAMTVLSIDVAALEEHDRDDLEDKPFGVMLEALDNLRPQEVYLASGSKSDYALWGELMSTRARHLGAAGAVMNGYARDTRGI